MVLFLSEDEARLVRCLNGRLVPVWREETGVAGVLRGVCGVQAQLPRAAALALRVRADDLSLSDVVRAREAERSAVRAWFMRGTLHLVAIEDAGWLLSVLGPVFVAAGRRRLAQLGLDEDAVARSVRGIRDALAENGPMTRAGVMDELGRRGVAPGADDRAGYPSTHLLSRAALEGIVVFGPDGGGEETYALSSDWGVPAYLGTREDALAEMVRRYLAAHGPAGPGDLAAWSGLGMRDARAAWSLAEAGFDEVRVAGRPAWVTSGSLPEKFLHEQQTIVRLLPHFDPHLLGHRDRSLVVPPEHVRQVQRGGGFVRPVAILDGKAIATWDYSDGGRPKVAIDPFEELAPDTKSGIEEDTEDVGRFLGTHPALSFRNS
jgi:hypothetical protein